MRRFLLRPPVQLFSGLILFLLIPTNLPAQTKYFFYNDARADALIRRGLSHSYNLEYTAAAKDWQELIAMYPDHPAGYVYRAALVWWEAVEDHEDKGLQERFERQNQEAIDKAHAWLKSHPQDKLGLAYLASAYGNKSRFDVTVTRSYLSALRNGKKAFKYIEMAHELDKNFYDAYIGLGSYNYFTGALPGVIKPFAWLLGARGDKNEGINQLILASQKGEYAQTEAKIILLSVYFNEKRWVDYERELEGLMASHPQNHVFYFWASNYYVGMKRWDRGIEEFRKLEKSINPASSDDARESLAWLKYNLGRNYFAKQDWGGALDALSAAEKVQPKTGILQAQIALMKGNLLDILGRRDEAVTLYQKVLELPDVDDSRGRARQYLRSKYK
ncbi:MAG: tetratricopeptide repeat protein [Acidobacteriia bacterium]|nr:tetratricopeptide repeat protein [Terriglobia bacterium]